MEPAVGPGGRTMRSLRPAARAAVRDALVHAAPTPCVGRYLVDDEPLDFGGQATNIPTAGS